MSPQPAPVPLKDPRFTGAFTAITTPFTDRGEAIARETLQTQIAFQAQGGLKGIVVSGTTGESPTLTEAEYKDLVKISIQHATRAKLLAIAGTGSNSTAHACELQKFAKGIGADATLSVNPYYNKPTQEGLYRHFMAVADAAHIPVILYNIPGRSGVALAPTTVERLNKHQNIVAIKEATGSLDSATEICMRMPESGATFRRRFAHATFRGGGGCWCGVGGLQHPARAGRFAVHGVSGGPVEGRRGHSPRAFRFLACHVPRDQPDPGQGRDEDARARYRRSAAPDVRRQRGDDGCGAQGSDRPRVALNTPSYEPQVLRFCLDRAQPVLRSACYAQELPRGFAA
jgi:dihydrodipicolinate synthase/N-acetylneuraminate lyase